MKKYLIMVLAIAISGVFVGCHEDELSGSFIEQKKMAFEETFIKAFGQPDPDHNWGFKTRATDDALTRTENANANEWADPNKSYGGLLVPPPLTDEQIAVVRKYFQTHPNLGYEDPKWSNYFIQQVYKGHTNVPENCATPEAYLAANGSSYIIASDHMDHLIAVDEEKGIYDHINNFNHGDCSTNGTVLDNGGNANDGPFHSDKIMYMMNSTTKSFGYHNSDGSLYHTEYTGLVSYKTIMQAMGAEANCLDDGWNRSFMGFDFEQMVGDDVYAANRQYGNYTAENNWQGELISLTYESYHYFTFEGNQYHYLDSDRNMYAADLTEESYKQKNGSNSTIGGVADFNDLPSDDIIRDLLSKGYLPVMNSADKVWVKVGGTADGYFSDWIVTLTEAKTENTNPSAPDVKTITGEPGKRYTKTGLEIVESGRVMCEDLATSDLDDYDYNDVVYDAIIFREYKYLCTEDGVIIEDENFQDKYDRTYANVRLMAAGGTIPVEMVVGNNNFDVHEELGAADNVMINTLPDTEEERARINMASVFETEEAKTLKGEDGSEKLYGVGLISDIKLNVLYNNTSTELLAKHGGATYMFLVDLGLPWAMERRKFSSGYPYFPDWVADRNANYEWYDKSIQKQYLYENPKLVGLTEPDIPDPVIEFYDNNGSLSSLEKKTVPANPGTMAYPNTSTETILYDFTTSVGPGYLCPKIKTADNVTHDEEFVTINAGTNNIQMNNTIRIYGVFINNWYIYTNLNSSAISSGAGNGYIDIPIDYHNVDIARSGITIKGQNFTVTYVTVF